MNVLLIIIIVLLGLIALLLYFAIAAIKGLTEGVRKGLGDIKELDEQSMEKWEAESLEKNARLQRRPES